MDTEEEREKGEKEKLNEHIEHDPYIKNKMLLIDVAPTFIEPNEFWLHQSGNPNRFSDDDDDYDEFIIYRRFVFLMQHVEIHSIVAVKCDCIGSSARLIAQIQNN